MECLLLNLARSLVLSSPMAINDDGLPALRMRRCKSFRRVLLSERSFLQIFRVSVAGRKSMRCRTGFVNWQCTFLTPRLQKGEEPNLTFGKSPELEKESLKV